jgi:hypothetical protein
MLPLIQDQLSHSAHTPYSMGLSLDTLERAGVDMDEKLHTFDDWQHLKLEDLQQRALNVSLLPEIERLWDAPCALVLAPLGEALGKLLLQQLQDGVLYLPRRCRQILAHLPDQQQHEFGLWCLEKWLALKGRAQDWLLLPLTHVGDLRCATMLVSAVPKMPIKKVPVALTALARMPHHLGLTLLNNLKNARKRDNTLTLHVKQVLALEAQHRGITVEALESLGDARVRDSNNG